MKALVTVLVSRIENIHAHSIMKRLQDLLPMAEVSRPKGISQESLVL